MGVESSARASDLPRVRFARGRPRLVEGFVAQVEGRRSYGGLAAVAAVAPGRSAARIQYWTFADITRTASEPEGPASYDLTVVSARPMGWEVAKTHGHVHVVRDEPGTSYPELYEVLSGRAGFLLQDLGTGPSSTFAALIEAGTGQVVVVPPGLHHATINLGPSPLIVGDLVCRSSDDDYTALRSAHGMAYYVGPDGAEPNPRYKAVPPLLRLNADDWSGPLRGSLYRLLEDRSALLDWLCVPARAERPGIGVERGGTIADWMPDVSAIPPLLR